MTKNIIYRKSYKYTRIDKRVARKLYNEGYIIAICGIKQRIDGFTQICKDFNDSEFDNLVNTWSYYNETYYGRPCYYIETPIIERERG